MEPYLIPTTSCEVEMVEKRSRFIGRLWPVESEEEARARIQDTGKQYHDARHTCWCYMLREGGIERYSDDGEPQGTAGQPMLELFRKKGIQNYCCTVTRYFGGILLGTGGLVRAYSHTAGLALEASGISIVRLWQVIETECSYSLLERAKLTAESCGGFVENVEYSASILMTVLVPAENAESFCQRITDLSSGTAFCLPAGERFMAAPHIPAAGE